MLEGLHVRFHKPALLSGFGHLIIDEWFPLFSLLQEFDSAFDLFREMDHFRVVGSDDLRMAPKKPLDIFSGRPPIKLETLRETYNDTVLCFKQLLIGSAGRGMSNHQAVTY